MEPTISPVRVMVESPSIAAIPKSVSSTRPSRAEQHVAGLDVAVQHAGGVRGAQRAQHVQADAGRLARARCALLLDCVGERGPVDVLHDDPGPAVVLQHVVDGDDGGVVDPGGGARLRLGAGVQHGPVALGDVERGGQLLDGDGAVQHLVMRAPHPAHAAAARCTSPSR